MRSYLFTLVFSLCLCYVFSSKEFRFDYEYDEEADGWLKFHIIPSTWTEARMRCHAEGAVLASPSTKQLKNAIIAFVNRKRTQTKIFTGVHAWFSKGDYTTIEGVPLSRLPITWAEDEPNNYENAESCLAMVTDDEGSTSDERCADVFPYVCYKKFANLTMTECGTTDTGYQLDNRTGSCYKFHRRGLVWAQGFMTCIAEGGHLVIINSDIEQEVVSEIFSNNPYHTIQAKQPRDVAVGFHDWGEHMTFMTIHGETLDEAGFQKWDINQPDNEGEFCGSVERSGTTVLLNDMWCNVPIPFLCEKSPDSLLDNIS